MPFTPIETSLGLVALRERILLIIASLVVSDLVINRPSRGSWPSARSNSNLDRDKILVLYALRMRTTPLKIFPNEVFSGTLIINARQEKIKAKIERYD